MAEHRVLFMEGPDAFGDDVWRYAQVLSESDFRSVIVREEFVEGGVEKADGNWAAFHGFEDTFEVFALDGEEFFKGGAAFVFVACEDHFAHVVNAVSFEEHVFCTAKADAFGAEGDSGVGLFWGIGICADVHFAVFICPLHDGIKELVSVAFIGFEFT